MADIGQFTTYPRAQREAIYAFQREYSCVLVRRIPDGAVVVEALDGLGSRRIVAGVIIDKRGRAKP